MTSNAGAREITRDATVGFRTDDGIIGHHEIKASAMHELKRLFRPEFINRVDEIVVFHSLHDAHVRSILEILLADVQTRLAEREMIIEVSRSARDLLIKRGYDPKYGARPLRRTIQREIEDPLALEILKGRFGQNSHIVVSVRNDQFTFRRKKEKVEASGETVPADEDKNRTLHNGW